MQQRYTKLPRSCWRSASANCATPKPFTSGCGSHVVALVLPWGAVLRRHTQQLRQPVMEPASSGAAEFTPIVGRFGSNCGKESNLRWQLTIDQANACSALRQASDLFGSGFFPSRSPTPDPGPLDPINANCFIIIQPLLASCSSFRWADQLFREHKRLLSRYRDGATARGGFRM